MNIISREPLNKSMTSLAYSQFCYQDVLSPGLSINCNAKSALGVNPRPAGLKQAPYCGVVALGNGITISCAGRLASVRTRLRQSGHRLVQRLPSITAACLLLLLSSNSLSQSSPVIEYTAKYQARANGIAATAERNLKKLSGNSYLLSNTLEAKLAGLSLARLKQSSEFVFDNGVLAPQNYSYLVTGVSKANHTIAYNWDAMFAISTEDEKSWRLPLTEGVLDQLSYQFALRQALPETSAIDTEFEFSLIDADEIETQRYRVMGDELLTTPLGDLNTVKLERLREESDGRVTEIWLAREWNFLLTRIEQVSGSGLRISLQLESAEMDGTSVTAAQ